MPQLSGARRSRVAAGTSRPSRTGAQPVGLGGEGLGERADDPAGGTPDARARMQQAAEAARESARERVDETRERASEAAETAKERVAEARERAAGAAATARERVQEVAESARRRRIDMPWSRSLPARMVRGVVQRGVLVPALSFISPVNVIGRRNLRALKGPAMFIANHQSHFDAPVCLSALGGKVRKRLVIAAAADYF